MKKFLVMLLVLFAVTSSAFAVESPVPPQKGQWGFALTSSLPLYEKADSDSDSEYVDFNDEWFKVSSAIRDDNDRLWYKVKIGKKSGWLAQEGVRLKLQNSGRSKAAANLYKQYKKKKSVLNSLNGMDRDDLRAKIGTATMRETPYDDAEVDILSYELSGRDMTLEVTLRNNEVVSAEFKEGRAGQTD